MLVHSLAHSFIQPSSQSWDSVHRQVWEPACSRGEDRGREAGGDTDSRQNWGQKVGRDLAPLSPGSETAGPNLTHNGPLLPGRHWQACPQVSRVGVIVSVAT